MWGLPELKNKSGLVLFVLLHMLVTSVLEAKFKWLIISCSVWWVIMTSLKTITYQSKKLQRKTGHFTSCSSCNSHLYIQTTWKKKKKTPPLHLWPSQNHKNNCFLAKVLIQHCKKHYILNKNMTFGWQKSQGNFIVYLRNVTTSKALVFIPAPARPSCTTPKHDCLQNSAAFQH